jgi:ATP-dependent Clp protease ATP-binding subunit ClpC
MYGDPKRIIRLDMSEYMSGSSVQRLFEIGDGSDSLADRVRRQPLSVVLLDEVEKAHPKVFDLLLGILGEGRLTDAAGQLVGFSMTMIIMTSNLGVSDTAPVGFGERHQEDYVRQVRQHFRPEFFNRIDHIVSFRHLSPSDLLRIVDLELSEARERTGLQRRQISLSVSDGARRMLGQLGFHPTRGARPLKRVIEEKVVTPLSIRLARVPSLSRRKLWIVKDADEILDRLNSREREDAIVIS